MAAPVGQTLAHVPQPAHTKASMATWSPSGVIAPVGQASRQLLQPTVLLREWAQSSAVKFTYRGFSNSPTMSVRSSRAFCTRAGLPGSGLK